MLSLLNCKPTTSTISSYKLVTLDDTNVTVLFIRFITADAFWHNVLPRTFAPTHFIVILYTVFSSNPYQYFLVTMEGISIY